MLRVIGAEVVIDIGYKSEGVIQLDEFEDPSKLEPGQSIEVRYRRNQKEMTAHVQF